MTLTRHPRVLVNINGNVPEWRACFGPPGDAPRLPLPCGFASLAGEGFSLAAYDASGKPPPDDLYPFGQYFDGALSRARQAVDYAVLWGTRSVHSCVAEAPLSRARRKTVMFSYGWRPVGPVSTRRRAMLAFTRQAARFARAVILMTGRQVTAARADLLTKVPVVQLRVGIDTSFYARRSTPADVPGSHQEIVETLLKEPYLILPGDELRLNNDALDVVQATGLRLVRISQYGYKSDTNSLVREIRRRGLHERVIVFERISYPFLRFLLQHAAAYAGFVDANWQPAGWTVACESLASGLPLLLYDGLTAHELINLGIPEQLLHVIEPGDRTAFAQVSTALAAASPVAGRAEAARAFAARELNVELTAPEFARNLKAALRIAS